MPSLILFSCLAAALLLPRWLLAWRYARRVHTPDQPPGQGRPVAIVFGAGLRRDGLPTTVLADRVATGVALYRRGVVDRLLMSGTRRQDGYDEPASMARMALELGVPDEAIELDSGGTRTIETCRRACAVFGVESALLVSQRYHLPRALALCQAAGIRAEAVAADQRQYRAAAYWQLREYPATLVALWESLLRPQSVRTSSSVPAVPEPDGTR